MIIDGFWLSILEYAQYRDISISTIRRYIKAKRVRYKLENGKYFVFVNDENYTKRNELQAEKLENDNKRLKQQLQLTTEELQDLKLLVALYEKKQSLTKEFSLPPLPE